MPDAPDFARIARDLVALVDPTFLAYAPTSDLETHNRNGMLSAIVAELKLLWNARGAADLVKLEAELTSMMGATAGGPYIKNLDRALRTLDEKKSH